MNLSTSSFASLLAGALAALSEPAAAGPPCAIPSTAMFLQPQAPDPSATFGRSVAIDGDGIAAGVPGTGPTVAGRVELFQRVDAGWTAARIVPPADGLLDDRFGFALAMQGDTLPVGAFRANGAEPNSGAAYVFRCIEGAWEQEAELAPPDGKALDDPHRDGAIDGADLGVLLAAWGLCGYRPEAR